MNQKQKKFILKVLIVLLTLISIGLLITFILAVVNKQKLLSMISGIFTIISPTTLVVIIIKYFCRRQRCRIFVKKTSPSPLNYSRKAAFCRRLRRSLNWNWFYQLFVYLWYTLGIALISFERRCKGTTKIDFLLVNFTNIVSAIAFCYYLTYPFLS